MDAIRKHAPDILVCVALFVVSVALYGRTVTHDFVNFDDNVYVTENQAVQGGLSAGAVRWAFTTFHSANWHPLTWLSHMLDCQLFAMRAGLHHLTSVLLHAANSLLLFLVLRSLTGRRWPSAFVVALFVAHPMHVESVAWVAERKDVLSTLCWFLAMAAYGSYVRRRAIARYAWVVVCLALGLMAKPMLVTLPVMLLMLDYWPLERLWAVGSGADDGADDGPGEGRRGIAWHAVEKVPLLFVALASGLVTLVAQKTGGAVRTLEMFPLGWRVSNAAVAYVRYLGKTAWPVRLSVYYPHPGQLPALEVAGSCLVLAAITGAAVLLAIKGKRYALAGWAWFVITLLPVIGLIQVGAQAMADRYTYIPHVGLFVAIAWGVDDLTRRWTRRSPVLACAAAVVLTALSAATVMQVRHWQNSVTLYRHSIRVTEGNRLMHFNLAGAHYARGEYEQAVEHYVKTLSLKPDYSDAHYNLGLTLTRLGRTEDAIACFRQELEFTPDHTEVHNNLGAAMYGLGRLEEAAHHFAEVVRINPGHIEGLNNLGGLLHELGRHEEALVRYREALSLNPDYPSAHFNMAVTLERLGRTDDAIHHYREASRIRPDDAGVRSRLEALLSAVRDPEQDGSGNSRVRE